MKNLIRFCLVLVFQIKFIVTRSTVPPTTIRTPVSTDFNNVQTTVDIFAPTAAPSLFGDVTSLIPASESSKVATGDPNLITADQNLALASETSTSTVDIFVPTAQNAFREPVNLGPSSAVPSVPAVVTNRSPTGSSTMDPPTAPTTVDIFAPTTPGSLIPTVPPVIMGQATDLPLSDTSTDLPLSDPSTDLPLSDPSTDLPVLGSTVNKANITGNDTAALMNDPQLQLTADILTQNTAKNEKCPKFPAKYVEDALVLDLYAPGGCQMVVTVMDITPLFNLFAGSPFWEFLSQRRVRIPSVAFRQVSRGNAKNSIICPKFPVEVTGSTVKVDTIPGACKMVLTTRTFPVGATSPNEGFTGSYTSMIVTRPVFESGNDGKS